MRVSPRNMKHRGFVVNERSARLKYRNTNGNCLDIIRPHAGDVRETVGHADAFVDP